HTRSYGDWSSDVCSSDLDFLIRVTQFFRDPEAFEALKATVFPALIDDRPAGHGVRVWVAGCATGEEVYSLAMCLFEYLDGRPERSEERRVGREGGSRWGP